MNAIIIGLLCVTSYIQCMNHTIEEKNDLYFNHNNGLTNLFSELFPGKEVKESVNSSQKVPLPLEKITIDEDMIPLLKQSFSVLESKTQQKINFITKSLVQKKNLEIIIPSLLIFSEIVGMGKSTVALSIADIMHQQAGWSIYRMESSDLANRFQNSGTQNFEEIGNKLLSKEKGSVLIFEDISFPHTKSDVSDKESTVTAFWQLLDRIKDNQKKHVLLLVTATAPDFGDMPNQIRERFLGRIINLTFFSKRQIEQYFDYTLKKQTSMHTPCKHAPRTEMPPSDNVVPRINIRPSDNAIPMGTVWAVTTCKLCQTECLNCVIERLCKMPEMSYSMLERIMDHGIRISTTALLKNKWPHTFMLNALVEATSSEKRNTERITLKMHKKYNSEQERLHKKQMKQQKRLNKEQFGLALWQLHTSIKNSAQQFTMNTALDNGGMPGNTEGKPEELLDKDQQQLYETIFIKKQPNNTSLLPKRLGDPKDTVAMRIIYDIFQELEKENYGNNNK